MKKILALLAMLAVSPAIAGEIYVDNKARQLTYVDDLGANHTYPVAVGKPGAQFHGSFVIDRMATNPSWTPTANMCRKEGVCKTVKGGPRNPLGPRAMYLAGTMYRIHGTTNPKSIGRAASHGCVRMYNSDVITLYSMVSVGTHVNVR